MNFMITKISSKECPKLMFKFSFEPPPSPHKIEFFNTHTLKTTVFIGDILEFSVILRSGLRIFFLHVLRHCEYNQYQIRKYYQ